MPRDPWARLRAADPTPDADLLARFAADRDPDAFELLVWRHGRMVFATCRRTLGDHHLAEDAFQATFLVLARKAGAVRGSAPAWLHRVALRVAGRAAKRANKSARLAADPPAPAVPVPDFALRAVLDEEIDRLPDRLRRAVVLCYLDGRTIDEAARLLGVPRGTVLSRLSAARGRLTARLTRRGVTGPAVGLAVGGEVLTADAVGRCVGEAVRFVTPGVAAGQSAALLAEGVMRATKLKAVSVAAGVVMAVAAGLGTGVGVVVAQKGAGPPAKAEAKAETKPPAVPVEPGRDDGVAAVEKALKDMTFQIDVLEDELRRLGPGRSDDDRRLKDDELGDLREQIRRLRSNRLRVETFHRNVAEILAGPALVPLKKSLDAARKRLADLEGKPGVKPDDPELAAARKDEEALDTEWRSVVDRATQDTGVALNITSLEFSFNNWDETKEAMQRAEEMLTKRYLDMSADQQVMGRRVEAERRHDEAEGRPIKAKLALLTEVRQQLRRELELRKLQAQGITLPEPARGADPGGVADKLDQILREVAALRAEVRAAAKK